MGHIRMIGAAQPFISGAISKTINVPPDATVEEIEQAYLDAWRLGTKAVSIYRDGSKRTQPLNTTRTGPAAESAAAVAADAVAAAGAVPSRRRLPDERQAITHKFDIAGHEGYITVGLFEDGVPGEIFLVMAKEGSTISGFADAFAQAVSYALQYGVPLQVLVDKFSHVRFEPSGRTRNRDVAIAKSIVDYIFRWMATKFLSPEAQFRAGVNVSAGAESVDATGPVAASDGPAAPSAASGSAGRGTPFAIQNDQDAPSCSTCGAIMIPQRKLLQVRQLRRHQRLRLTPATGGRPRRSGASGRVVAAAPEVGQGDEDRREQGACNLGLGCDLPVQIAGVVEGQRLQPEEGGQREGQTAGQADPDQ